jgi:sialate O-acetylesterase
MMRKWICALVALMAITAHAKVTLPKFFSDNMVLQQRSECKLWGKADANKTVSILTSWDNKTYKVKSNSQGDFEVKLKTPEAGGPYDIVVNESSIVILRNVMIGEVWICSGQSNMEMLMKGYKAQPVEGAAEELLTCQDDGLRLFYGKRRASLEPQQDLTGTWQPANAASVREFSATAYFFGKALRRVLGVPVGLICTAFGGSACEAWMQADWLKAFPKVKQTITEEDVKKLQQRCPTALYNGQLKPLIGYGIRGAIWYQGEDNVPRYDYYAPLMARMIQGWREDWKQGDFPFYYCQIAPWGYDETDWALYNSAFLREQQEKVESMVPNCRMAVLMDTGIKDVIHPRKKRQAGERLAILALSNTYDIKGLPDFAKYKEVTFQNDTAVVSFDRSKEWVYFEHVNCLTKTDANGKTVSRNFEVAGADRVFHPATKVWASRNRVYVICDKVKKPVAVRYAFKDFVIGDLMHDGLPVSSFRTDDWVPTMNAVNKTTGDYNNPK